MNEIKRFVKLQLRFINDLKSGNRQAFALKNNRITNLQDFQPQIRLTQPILPSSTKANKIHNLQIATQKLEKLVLQPDSIFSFWHFIGNPSEKNGYKKGRNILNGQLSEAVGGGLCQLSGIIHHLLLLAGFPILERHAHTVDLYTESERFTPLGADATVVYGYKDLRFRQHFTFPVFFHFEIKNDLILCELWATQNIDYQTIEFKKTMNDAHILVETICNGKVIEISKYLPLK
jgi:vancomycin resistance protein VanW